MFYVIQKVYNAQGVQIDSDSIAEYATLKEANDAVELLYNTGANGPDDAGVYATFHVENS